MQEEIYKNLSLEDLPGEVWKDIVGYEGLYQVSNLGRMKVLKHPVNRGFCKCFTKESIIKPRIKDNGYLFVCLSKGTTKSMKNRYIHRLVAEAFIPNNQNKPQVDHIDGDKKNNIVENLIWATQEENINNICTKYRSKKIRGIVCILNDNTIKKYKSISDASKDLGIPVCSIHYILTHKIKSKKYNMTVIDDNKVDACLMSEYARRMNL